MKCGLIKWAIPALGAIISVALALAWIRARSEARVHVTPIRQIVAKLPPQEQNKISSMLWEEVKRISAHEPAETREELELEKMEGLLTSIDEARAALVELDVKVPGWIPSDAQFLGAKVERAPARHVNPAEKLVLFYETPRGMIQVSEEIHQPGVEVIIPKEAINVQVGGLPARYRELKLMPSGRNWRSLYWAEETPEGRVVDYEVAGEIKGEELVAIARSMR